MGWDGFAEDARKQYKVDAKPWGDEECRENNVSRVWHIN